jgi:iron complex outermembrane recepter protein
MDQQVLPYDPQKGFVDIPFSRNLAECNLTETENIFVGFNWSHQFNDDWSIKHQSTFKRQDVDTGIVAFPAEISLATHDVSRFVGVNKAMAILFPQILTLPDTLTLGDWNTPYCLAAITIVLPIF